MSSAHTCYVTYLDRYESYVSVAHRHRAHRHRAPPPPRPSPPRASPPHPAATAPVAFAPLATAPIRFRAHRQPPRALGHVFREVLHLVPRVRDRRKVPSRIFAMRRCALTRTRRCARDRCRRVLHLPRDRCRAPHRHGAAMRHAPVHTCARSRFARRLRERVECTVGASTRSLLRGPLRAAASLPPPSLRRFGEQRAPIQSRTTSAPCLCSSPVAMPRCCTSKATHVCYDACACCMLA